MLKREAATVNAVIFLTDALSVLEALTNKVPEIVQALNRLSTTYNVAHWIHALCGVAGSEQADQLAKEGAQTEQPNYPISYKEIVSIIKAVTKPKQEADVYHCPTRAEQVVMVRLRSGHNSLNAHVFRKYKLVHSPTCPCGRRRPNPNSRPYPPKMQKTRPGASCEVANKDVSPSQDICGYRCLQEDHILHRVVRTPEKEAITDR